MEHSSRAGFTLIELVVVMGLMILIGAFVVVSLATRKTNTDLMNTTTQIQTLLRQAQSDSMAEKNGVAWGVHFENSTSTTPFYAIFYTSYATATTAAHYPLLSSVSYNTTTLASGAKLDVIFSLLTGSASASTSVGLFMPDQSAAFSSTISIASSGAVSY
jgi:type II secretory pathway pseudopilin PulG